MSVGDLHSGATVTARVESIKGDVASVRIRLTNQDPSSEDYKLVRAKIHVSALNKGDGDASDATYEPPPPLLTPPSINDIA